MADTMTIALKGDPYAVVFPDDFSLVAEAAQAIHAARRDTVRTLQVASALVLLCCPVVGHKAAKSAPGLTYEAHGYSMVSFGRAAYNWLHTQAVSSGEIADAFTSLVGPLLERAYPTEVEVSRAMGKSPATAAP